MDFISSYLLEHLGNIFSIVFSIIAAYGIVEFLNWRSGPDMEVQEKSQFQVSSEVTPGFVTFHNNTGSNYFNSIGRLYVCLSTPYMDYYKQFKIEASIDEINWVTIPVYFELPKKDQLKKYSDLGLIDLNSLIIKVNTRSTISPQTLEVPVGVTKEKIANSITGSIVIKKLGSSRDIIIKLLMVITIWSLLIKLFDMLIFN